VKLLRRVGTRSTLVIAAATILAIGITSIATGAAGSFVRIGKRNAAPGTTAIVGSTSGYATRQSNNTNNDGGAASYGCRADVSHEACLFVLNHNGGQVFQFSSNGGVNGGRILVSPPSGKTAKDVSPFTTNATGVATGLNADQVDGKSADDIVASAQASDKFASVAGTTGALGANRGATSSTRASAGVYDVVFNADVSKCSRTATISGATPGFVTTDAGANAQTVTVRTFDTAATPAPTDHSFDLTVTC
jgi:hypothetical protein